MSEEILYKDGKWYRYLDEGEIIQENDQYSRSEHVFRVPTNWNDVNIDSVGDKVCDPTKLSHPSYRRPIRFYKYDEWDILEDKFGDIPLNLDDHMYVDSDDNLITGILENYFYFSEGDERNHVYVENGKRK